MYEELTHLSPSTIELWGQCRRRFREERLMGRRGGSGPEALRGTFCHLVMEKLMILPPGARTIAAARRIAREQWIEFIATDEWLDFRATAPTFDVQAFRRSAWEGLLGYFSIEDPREVEVLATERKLTAEVGGVRVKGIIDRIERDAFDDVVLTDYKFGKMPKPWFCDKLYRQLRIYALLVREALGIEAAEGQLIFPSGQGGVVSVPFSAEDLEATGDEVAATWVEIRTAMTEDRFERSPSPLCGWCDFVAVCPEGQEMVRKRVAEGLSVGSAPEVIAAANAAGLEQWEPQEVGCGQA